MSILHRSVGLKDAVSRDAGSNDPGSKETHANLSKVLAISQVNRRRAVGDRKVLFVAAALPVMLILVIGFVSGRDVRAPLGIVEVDHGPIATRLVSLLESFPSVQVHVESNVGSERDGVLRGQLLGALVIPDGFDASVRANRTATLQVLTRSGNTAAFQTQVAVSGAYDIVVAEWQSAERLAASTSPSTTVQSATVQSTAVQSTTVQSTTAAFKRVTALTDVASKNAAARFGGGIPGPYSYTTAANLVLFVFLTLLVTSSGLVEMRRIGLLRRMLASPTPAGVVVVGQLISSAILGLAQGVGLLVVGRLVFGVRWGDPVGVLILIVVLAAAASGASVLLGTLARSQEQAVAVGIVVAVALGMLGGCMWPLSGVGPLMRTVGHVAPQAWAMDAFVRLIFGHSGLLGILPDIGVLALFAVGLVVLAATRLRTIAMASGRVF